MATQQQGKQLDKAQEHVSQHKPPAWMRWLIAILILLLIAISTTIWLLTNQRSWIAVLPAVIFAVVSVLIGLFQWLFPISSSTHEHQHALTTVPTSAEHLMPQIIVQLPTTQLLSPPPSDKIAHRGIVGIPPPTDPRTIQQREHLVKDIYARLTQPGVTAIALTGIGGVGKSTLAALVYRYAEEQRLAGTAPFLAEALWLTVDPAVTFADLAGNIFEALARPLPDLSNLAPQNQAVALFNALNTTDKSRLVILDQFENLLDWETGHALSDRPGVGEWVDIINSQQCNCRNLLTSRPRPIGTREYPPTYVQEYPIGGLEVAEGIELLKKLGVSGTEEELQSAVVRCEGHAFSLTLLASLVRNHNMGLAALFKDPALWRGDIARDLLEFIYTRQLSPIQRELLLAFSVYREPVAIEAAQAIMAEAPKAQVSFALKALLTQHLLGAVGEGRYQLHAIVAEFAKGCFVEDSEQDNQKAEQVAHAKAAQYYMQQAAITCPPREMRRRISDVHDLIEAIWQWCQAERWQEAYGLIEQEEIFSSLKQWGGNAILLELCLLLQSGDDWSPKPSQSAVIHGHMAWAYNALGKGEWARKNYEKALQLYTESGDLEGRAKILDYLGWSYYTLGQMNQAIEYYEQALGICKERGDRQIEGHVLNGLGRVYIVQGQREQALEYFEQALAICKEVGNPKLEGRTLSNLGIVHTDLGNNAKALGYLEQSLAIRKNVGDRRGEAVALDNLGRVYKELGQNERAVQYFEETLSICQIIGDRGLEGWALNNLGWTYLALGQYEQARKVLEQALHIRQEVGDRRGEGRTYRNLGESLGMLGQKRQAMRYYKQALLISQEIQDPYGEATILKNVAFVYVDQARYDIALSCFLVAKRIFDELHSPLSNDTQNGIDTIHKKIGNDQFAALLAQVEPQASQIVEQALREPIE